MKKQIMTALMSASLLLALAALSAKAQSSTKITVEIPFEFVINGNVFQPGKYAIGRFEPSRPDLLTIKSPDGAKSKTFVTQRVDALDPENQTKLLFDRYGEVHFLSEVWVGGDHNGRRLPASEAEGEMRRNGVKPKTVAVLASGKTAPRR